VYERVFIGVSARTYMSICVSAVFLKKYRLATGPKHSIINYILIRMQDYHYSNEFVTFQNKVPYVSNLFWSLAKI
jgi:hypothetical protein